MESKDAEYEARLKAFQADLSRPSSEIVQKHILTGSPVALAPDDYFALRHEVALHFRIHPVEVVLVGSCRIGFSLTDKCSVETLYPVAARSIRLCVRTRR